jgi:MFS family permease
MSSESSSPDFEAAGGRFENFKPAQPGSSQPVPTTPPRAEQSAKAFKKNGMFRALRHRNFRLFWGGALVSNIGNWMQTVAQNWLVLSLTHSPFLLGLVNFVTNAPMLVLGLFGGVVADRNSRKQVLMVTQSLMGGLIMLMALLSFLNVIQFWMVLVIALAIGCVQAFNSPAYQTIALDLVGKDDLMNAIALNSLQFNLTRVIGPSIAGALVVAVGVAACFFLNSLSFLAVIGALLLVRLPAVPAREGKASALREIREGLSYLRRQPAIAALVVLSGIVSILIFPYITLLSVFAQDVFHSDASDYGLLLACVGVGAAVGAMFVASRNDAAKRSPIVFGGAAVSSVTLLIFALSSNLYLSMAILTLVGGSLVVMMATMNTIVQASVPQELRGRVISIYTLSSMGMLPVGNLQAGAVAQSFGAPVAVGGGAILFAVCAIATYFLVPTLKET